MKFTDKHQRRYHRIARTLGADAWPSVVHRTELVPTLWLSGGVCVQLLMFECERELIVSGVSVTPRGTGIGTRLVEELLALAAKDKLQLRFSQVINPAFFQRFSQLTAEDHDFVGPPPAKTSRNGARPKVNA